MRLRIWEVCGSRLLYDNLKSVVVWRDAEEVVHWNPRFLDFADVAGFSPQARPPVSAPDQGEGRERGEIGARKFLAGLTFSGSGRSQHSSAGLAQHHRQPACAWDHGRSSL